MYTKTSNSENITGFQNTVLDPLQSNRRNYNTKPDFLSGRKFFKHNKFLNCPCLDTLLIELASLLAACYDDPPTREELELIEEAQKQIRNSSHNDQLWEYLEKSYVSLHGVDYMEKQAALSNHKATLKLFKKALETCSM